MLIKKIISICTSSNFNSYNGSVVSAVGSTNLCINLMNFSLHSAIATSVPHTTNCGSEDSVSPDST